MPNEIDIKRLQSDLACALEREKKLRELLKECEFSDDRFCPICQCLERHEPDCALAAAIAEKEDE